MRISRSILLLSALASSLAAQERDVSQLSARPSVPWVRDALIYELNPRTFSATGNFGGVVARLDDLKSTGVSIVWLMPIHPLGELKKKGTIGSPYAVRDYYAINPAYGTKDDLKRLVSEAHRRGLRVIIDIVANHTSWDNVMMSTPSYYRRDAQGKIVSPYDWTDVAALDYTNGATRKYMTDMLKYWIREFDLDGFRCDVAGEVPTDFWENARAELEKIKPELVMLAEAAKPDLLVRAFDLDYAWPFYGTMADVITNGRSAQEIGRTWEMERRMYPRGAMHMRFTENHDEDRAIARFGERAAMAAAALVFSLDGVPMLYNGQEAGDVTESGAPALFENMKVFWGDAERRPEIVDLLKRLVALRREHAAFRQGQTVWLRNSDQDRVVTFLRRDGAEEFLVAVNLSNKPFSGTVEASGAYSEVALTPGDARPTGLPAIALDAWGYRIFRR
ncbi:MAG TPA: alpha-amylase family glycosyl hydrolase [Gemmatimonadaceae bacterium]|nr:alpha-amylase family glycosyl hydrolase [Gemmatimonadaceae bacterium]